MSFLDGLRHQALQRREGTPDAVLKTELESPGELYEERDANFSTLFASVYMCAVDWHLAAAAATANPIQHTRTPACLVSGCKERGAASDVKSQRRDPQSLASSSHAKAVTHQQEDPQEASVCATQGDSQDAPLAVAWSASPPENRETPGLDS